MALNTVQALDGYIEVSSKPGRGSIFKIFLPETDNTASKSNDATTDTSLRSNDSNIPTGEGVVLLVDDDNLMRKLTAKLLEKFGYTVISTGNGYDALNLYLEHLQEISCVILDISTQEMSNADTYFALQEINPQVRVIALSDTDQDESSVRLRENGFTDFIRRPFSQETLAKTLKRLTETDIEVS
jgi:Response regulator containing CheY-like receiver, AAA-type ATPase, and DNA-binding domains